MSVNDNRAEGRLENVTSALISLNIKINTYDASHIFWPFCSLKHTLNESWRQECSYATGGVKGLRPHFSVWFQLKGIVNNSSFLLNLEKLGVLSLWLHHTHVFCAGST